MNVNELVRLNANTSQTTSSDAKPAQYNHGYHDGYASGLGFGITFAVDRVLEIIDKVDEEYELLALKFQKVREAVLALKGEQDACM